MLAFMFTFKKYIYIKKALYINLLHANLLIGNQIIDLL